MSHKDFIIDSDAHFIIDPITREITNQSDKTVLMQYDHNSERLTFEVDNIVEGHEMSECNRVEIHYINIASDKRSRVNSFYTVDDLKLENGKLTFSWLVSRNVTQLAGAVSFVVRFICMDGDIEVYSWSTAKSDILKVVEGIDNSGVIDEDYSDIIAQWYNIIVKSGTEGVTKIKNAKNDALEEIREKTTEILSDMGIVQNIGDSESAVMSQKAVTEALKTASDNNEKNLDYDQLENRPFYKERTLIVNEDLSNYEFDWDANPIVDIRADGLLQLELNEQGFATVNVEIEDNGTIYKEKGYFVGYNICDNQACYLICADGKFTLQDFYDGTLQICVNEPTTLEGVVFRIYVDTIKKIDTEYLPPNSVPYLYGEEILIGGVMLAGLKSGAYILHGYIDVTGGVGEYIPDFIDKPTFVNVINDGNGRVNVYWLDTDDYADDSVCVRTMTVVDGTLVADNAISLADLKDGVDAAVEVAMGATENVDGAFAEIVAIHEEIAAIQDAIATINDKIYS